jgi:antitoxin (DNA-binding transcriptional repressor) of toxin-antitoxin stability system
MPSINLSQLRDTQQLIAWLKAGLTVELCESGRVIGHIVPVVPWPLHDEDGTREIEGKE